VLGVADQAATVIRMRKDTDQRLALVREKFASISPILVQSRPDHMIARPMEEAMVQTTIAPSSPDGFYRVIEGDDGSGKSTLVRNVCKQQRGVVYVKIQDAKTFGSDFATAVGYTGPTSGSVWQYSFLGQWLAPLPRQDPQSTRTILL